MSGSSGATFALKLAGAGMKGAGEYLQGKSSSSPSGEESDNGLIDKIIQGNSAKKVGSTKLDGNDGSQSSTAEGAEGTAGTASGGTAGGTAGSGSGGAGGGGAGGGGAGGGGGGSSDARLKRVCGDNADLINLFSKIGSYEFNYTDKAKSLYPNGENHVDGKRHVGVMAQELEKNPATNAVINTDKNGYKTVDTVQLTLTNTAVLADVCRRLEALEKQLGI